MSGTAAQRNAAKDGVNVQVVVRCRPLNPKEHGRRVHEVVTCANNEICVEDRSQSFKRYSFDRVFGPDSTQETVFDKAILPFVENVLEGFNCTIFAYGQTGTGKTYTMGSDSSSVSPSGEMTSEAGIIPRTVRRIFHKLQGSDSTVTVNFLELYNEELTDLLDPWSDQVDKDGNRKKKVMRIMEEQQMEFGSRLRRGIQLAPYPEDCVVTSEAEILQILERGSAQRQTAETLLNDKSSRSHSIFIISIHTRETKSTGDDVIKIGKLNLVDLAGSENVSRSGSDRTEERQREAGNINQSLLTLGRVINALVDKSSHVPYRDSNLTRLLRDSLGGSTKTLMIATISSGEYNQEETYKTLDYAKRAKSIKNKPEVNQRISKVDLVKDLHAEIKRLKEELVCQRRKQGVIVIPLDKHAQNEMERKNLLKEMDETNDRVKEIENENLCVKENLSAAVMLHKSLEDKLQCLGDQFSDQSLKLKDQTYWAEMYKQNCEELVSQLNSQSHNLDNTMRALKIHEEALQELSQRLENNKEISIGIRTIVKERIDQVHCFLEESIRGCESRKQELIRESEAKKAKRETESRNLVSHVERIASMQETTNEESSKIWICAAEESRKEIDDCREKYERQRQTTEAIVKTEINTLTQMALRREQEWKNAVSNLKTQGAQRSEAIKTEHERFLVRKRKLEALKAEAETAEKTTIAKIQETTSAVLKETMMQCLTKAMPQILEVMSQATQPGKSMMSSCQAALSQTEITMTALTEIPPTINDSQASIQTDCDACIESTIAHLQELKNDFITGHANEVQKALQRGQMTNDGLQSKALQRLAQLRTSVSTDVEEGKADRSVMEQEIMAFANAITSIAQDCSHQLKKIQEHTSETMGRYDLKSSSSLIDTIAVCSEDSGDEKVEQDSGLDSSNSKSALRNTGGVLRESQASHSHRLSNRVVRKAKRGKHNPVKETGSRSKNDVLNENNGS